jgi:hypothetical protein
MIGPFGTNLLRPSKLPLKSKKYERSTIIRLTVFVLVIGFALSRDTDALPKRTSPTKENTTYLGFDRNKYPGNANLEKLRKTFYYAGYWLNNPPGESSNTWSGKRMSVREHGFGFLVLFNGRLYKEIQESGNPKALGSTDAKVAVGAAQKEGFPAQTIIFLDQEEGGRLLPEQRDYLHSWIDYVNSTNYKAGLYCSGVLTQDSSGASITTAADVHSHAGQRLITYWVSNDTCRPSPGCVFPKKRLPPPESGVSFAEIWQFAQSPRRKALTSSCSTTYNPDGNCYAPGFIETEGMYIDVNSATSRDPSHGRGSR